MYFKNQKFLVAGLSKSGESSARFLLARGAEVYLYDDVISEAVSAVCIKLEELGAHVISAGDCDQAAFNCDVLVLSPGIPIDTALPIAFRKQGKAIIGEEELGALYLRATAVAVTGTNGKTTTVSMLNDAINACGKHSVACGNIGNPLVKEVENLSFDDFAVVEVSSFQLETLSSLRPHIAIITNVTEDHLNRHYNMENYIFLKAKILRNLRESEYAVLNYDDPVVRGFAKNCKAKVVYFSAQGKIDGAYAEGGSLFFKGEKYLDTADMILGGVHNIYNALACIAAAGILGLDKNAVGKSICAFKGIKHRIEKIREFGGVTYIDDSKGTNADATVKAAQAMKAPTVILLGGKDKGYDYGPLFESLNSTAVIHAVIYGENRFKMLNAAIKAGFVSVSLCSEFATAVKLAAYIAKPGQNVLLSPASSSFDSFANYEERGDAFKALVENLDEAT